MKPQTKTQAGGTVTLAGATGTLAGSVALVVGAPEHLALAITGFVTAGVAFGLQVSGLASR